jgi:phage baseplate assembly protein V
MNAQERQILSDMARKLENLITLGTVAELDHPGRRLRVQSGELLTDWLPWPAELGRNHIRWRPLRLGQQLILACPSGDPAQAAIVGQLYSATLLPPSTDENLDIVQWDDGSLVSYDSAAHRYTIAVNGGDIQLNATGNVDAAIGGNLEAIAEGHAHVIANTIELDGAGGGGVKGLVQGDCMCAYTGAPHPQVSGTVKGSS